MVVSDQYMAGVMDSDGCFMLRRDTSRSEHHCVPEVSIKWTVPAWDVMGKIQRTYGGCVTPHRDDRPNRAALRKWRLSRRTEIAIFLDRVAPHVLVKRGQALLLRDVVERLIREHRLGTPRSPALRAYMRDALAAMKEMNRTGRQAPGEPVPSPKCWQMELGME